jgi:uncharacterized protein (DUF1778 family)
MDTDWNELTPQTITLFAEAFARLEARLEEPARELPKLKALLSEPDPWAK